MEKKMFIVVSAKNADRNYQSEVYVPQYLTREAVVLILKNHLWKSSYRVKAYDEKPSHWIEESDYGTLGYDIFADFDAFIKHLETVKLYRLETIEHTKKVTKVVEIRKFKLSSCFVLKDVIYRGDEYCLYVDEGVTFFNIERAFDVKDVAFVDTDLKEKLGAKLALSGSYFLHGQWKFFRSKSRPVDYYAVKLEEKTVVTSVEDKLVAI